MKKNKIFSGLGAKLALAVMALTSTLFTSCEKEDFNATFEAAAAKAIIKVSAYDAENGTELTPTNVSASAGTVSGTEITIVGAKDIAKQTVTVKVACKGLEGEGKVEIPALKAGTVGNYSISFLVGKEIVMVPEPPVYDKAKAVITAVAEDGNGAALEDVTFAFASTKDGGVQNGNTFTIEGNKAIEAQAVTVTATYGDIVSEKVVDVPEVKEGHVYNYQVVFRFEKGETEVVTYVVEKEARNAKVGERIYLTGNYNHTHNGIDNWLTNETEYLLNAKVTYKVYDGVEVIDKNIVEESDYVTALIEKLNVGITSKEETFEFPVSAWSIYTAWSVITEEGVNYTVKSVAADGTEKVLATFGLVSRSVVVDHYEAAHPDHSHAYVHGHGHSHNGSANAGGGIVMPD